jgi:hypothetical protein
MQIIINEITIMTFTMVAAEKASMIIMGRRQIPIILFIRKTINI